MTTTTTELIKARPYTPHCQVIHDDGAHAVIGISPGNSYFTHRRIAELAAWGLDHFEQVDLIWTDLHVADMYEALGYPLDDARRKAVKQLRGVRAKANAAVTSLDPNGKRLRGRPMSALLDLPAYRQLRTHLDDLLATDREFRTVCDQLVDEFLTSKVLGGQAPTDRQRDVCRAYVIAEAPLFLDTPAILDVPSSLNCYHQALPMADLLYARGHGLRASRNQGHAIVTPADATQGELV
ncbi:tRNA-dependent cyclodipeptide synthase [Streptomyces sp. NPDC050844]|uniref:tRNA-dependent cyclodipeptide synthase n=1 Tax=Streptomyces sp. NPDC050844 TaxID=3155790 RepID=UPI0033F05617